MKTVVIVQARSGSSRLPGKVLMSIGGSTVLAWVLRRCALIEGIDAVVCAIPAGEADDVVAVEAERSGAAVWRGSEQDVLDRYYQAACAFGADVVLRVTSDCPAIDPAVAASVIKLRAETAADFAANNFERSWPHGLDVECFTFPALERAWREATTAHEREHVGPYMRDPSRFQLANLAGPGLAQERWTLDFPEDYAFFEALFDELPADGRWGWRDVLDVVRRRPDIAALNAAHRSH
jgi:spore coat polysaccharide biosynthesis protein SpsF (cytidylyltransferase family)